MTQGDLLKVARKHAGLTQKELGQKLGVSGAAIAQYENNLRHPKYETLQRIAKALDVDITKLDSQLSKSLALDLTAFLEDQEVKNVDSVEYFADLSDGDIITIPMNTEEGQLLYNFQRLNRKGREEAMKRISELTEIKRYQLNSNFKTG